MSRFYRDDLPINLCLVVQRINIPKIKFIWKLLMSQVTCKNWGIFKMDIFSGYDQWVASLVTQLIQESPWYGLNRYNNSYMPKLTFRATCYIHTHYIHEKLSFLQFDKTKLYLNDFLFIVSLYVITGTKCMRYVYIICNSTL